MGHTVIGSICEAVLEHDQMNVIEEPHTEPPGKRIRSKANILIMLSPNISLYPIECVNINTQLCNNIPSSNSEICVNYF